MKPCVSPIASKMLRRGILVAMILSFLASFHEAKGTFLVGVPTYITMPTEMYTLVLNYPEQAAAVFSILLSIPSMALMPLVRKHVMGAISRKASRSGRRWR